jgi:hypothetical protein
MCENLVMGTELPLVKKVSLYNCEIDSEKRSFQIMFSFNFLYTAVQKVNMSHGYCQETVIDYLQ